MLIGGLISGRAAADDMVLKWNEIAARTAAAATNPFNQARDITVTTTVPALGTLPAKTITQHYTQFQKIADDMDDARVFWRDSLALRSSRRSRSRARDWHRSREEFSSADPSVVRQINQQPQHRRTAMT